MDLRDEEVQGLISMITESYRMREFTGDLVSRISDPKINRKGINQVSRFDKFFFNGLDKLGMQILNFTGSKYDTGLPITPINLEDFNDGDDLIIEVMLEPTIKFKDTADIIKKGVVVLGRINK